MGSKNIALIFILCLLIFSCSEFKGEKIELNYKEGYVKILSNDYVVDSVIVKNHIDKYYVIGLSDKSEGESIIYFKKENLGYTIYSDSLDFYCSKPPKVNSPGLDVFIRKKGFIDKYNKKKNIDIEYFNYNKIPCNLTIIDTIEASNPYK